MPGVTVEVGRPVRSGTGGHVGGQDVIRVAVKSLAGAVVAHHGARVGVAGCDLDVPQVHSGVQNGGDEGMAEHMRVWPGDADPSGFGEPPQAASGGVTVHPGAAAVYQDGAASAGADRAVDGPPDCWRQWYQDDRGPFAAHAKYPVTVLFAEISDVRAGCFEYPQAEQPEHGHQGKVALVW
jgi:hypothetical protein